MLLPASPEFVDLCRSQVALVTQGLGASLGAVYLTEELADTLEQQLVPVVVYPEGRTWQRPAALSLPAGSDRSLAVPLDSANPLPTLPLLKPQQLVLPLIHNDLVLGFLVVGRDDRQWQDWEQTQLEEVAHTLAIARFLDQRSQWLEHSQYHQGRLRGQQDTLANLLHQFRNPLTTLRTLGKLLLKRLQPEDPNRSIATSILQESDRLQDLLRHFDQVVEDLGEAALDTDSLSLPVSPPSEPVLDTPSEPEQSAIKQLPPASGVLTGSDLPLTACSAAAILQPLLTSAAAVAEERNLELQAAVPPDLPPVRANPAALREVCSNLIDNALKYTPAGGTIKVQLFQSSPASGDRQQIAISNTGPGIPPQDLTHLFERHYRGVQAQTNIPGTGLGLAIAHRLMAQMGGAVQVFSPARVELPAGAGPGVTFVVTLPEICQSVN